MCIAFSPFHPFTLSPLLPKQADRATIHDRDHLGVLSRYAARWLWMEKSSRRRKKNGSRDANTTPTSLSTPLSIACGPRTSPGANRLRGLLRKAAREIREVARNLPRLRPARLSQFLPGDDRLAEGQTFPPPVIRDGLPEGTTARCCSPIITRATRPARFRQPV